MNKHNSLEQAVEIIKEWARGGAQGSLAGHLEEVYRKLVELKADANKD